jgi:hypothetical protein
MDDQFVGLYITRVLIVQSVLLCALSGTLMLIIFSPLPKTIFNYIGKIYENSEFSDRDL